jgi:hypothetical protein
MSAQRSSRTIICGSPQRTLRSQRKERLMQFLLSCFISASSAFSAVNIFCKAYPFFPAGSTGESDEGSFPAAATQVLGQLRVRTQERTSRQVVHVAQQKRPDSILHGPNDWLLMHIEAGVNQHRNARSRFICLQDLVETRVASGPNQLRTSRTIDVNRCGTVPLHFIGAVERDGHELGRLLAPTQILE